MGDSASAVSPVTMLHEPSSHPSLVDHDTRVSWSVWARRTATSETRLSPTSRYSHLEVPSRARYHHQLGRYGEDLAPHLLQRAPSCPRGVPNPPHRGPTQPKGQ